MIGGIDKSSSSCYNLMSLGWVVGPNWRQDILIYTTTVVSQPFFCRPLCTVLIININLIIAIIIVLIIIFLIIFLCTVWLSTLSSSSSSSNPPSSFFAQLDYQLYHPPPHHHHLSHHPSLYSLITNTLIADRQVILPSFLLRQGKNQPLCVFETFLKSTPQ